MKIAYLIHNVYGIGGTIQTVITQAAALRHRHEVEIVSVFRHREHPVLSLPQGITVTPLVDMRLPAGPGTGTGGRRLHEGSHRAGLPPEVFPVEESRQKQYSALTDDRLRAYLETTDADVVVGTRAGLNVVLARCGSDRYAKVGQEHLTHNMHPEALRRVLSDAYGDLDAVVTVTEADAAVHRKRMDLPGVRVLAIPNSVEAPRLRAPTGGRGERKVVVAAGRIAPVKRYELLVEAFARVLPDHPGWTLRIYGGGDQKARLKKQIDALGLHDDVLLMGPRSHLEEAWALGSFAAVTSKAESFGMTLVEAMRGGLPVVSTDCPLGPGEIIENGVDGLLVENGSVTAVAAGLDELMSDNGELDRMARAAARSAERFDPGPITRQHEALFHELTGHALPTTPVPAKDREPASCTARVDGEGVTTLSFTQRPDRVLLRGSSGTTAEFTCLDDGTLELRPHDPLLAPGRWSVHRVDGGEEGPVSDVVIDLLAYPPALSPSRPLGLTVPDRDTTHHLAVVIRRARLHAEVQSLVCDAGSLTFTGVFLGATGPFPDARLVASPRGRGEPSHSTPCPIAADGTFTASVQARAMLARRTTTEQEWDLHLVHRPGAPGARLGRHLDGVLGHRDVITYPTVTVTGTETGDVGVRPVFGDDDALGLAITDTGIDSRATMITGAVDVSARLESLEWSGSALRLRVAATLVSERARGPVLHRANGSLRWEGANGEPVGPDLRLLERHNRVEVVLRSRNAPKRTVAFALSPRSGAAPCEDGADVPGFVVDAELDLAGTDGGAVPAGQWDVLVRVRHFGVEADGVVDSRTPAAEEQRRPAFYGPDSTFADPFWHPEGRLTLSVDNGLNGLHRAVALPQEGAAVIERAEGVELVVPVEAAVEKDVELVLHADRDGGDTVTVPAVLSRGEGTTVLRAALPFADARRPGVARLRVEHGEQEGGLGLALSTTTAGECTVFRVPDPELWLTSVETADEALRVSGTRRDAVPGVDGLAITLLLVHRGSDREFGFAARLREDGSFDAEVPLSASDGRELPDGVFDVFASSAVGEYTSRVRLGAKRVRAVRTAPSPMFVAQSAGRRTATAYFTAERANLSLEVGRIRNAPVSAVRVESASWKRGGRLRIVATPEIEIGAPFTAVVRATAKGAAPLEAPARVSGSGADARIDAALRLGTPRGTAERVWEIDLVLSGPDSTRCATALRPAARIGHTRFFRGPRGFTGRPAGKAGERLAVRVKRVPLLRRLLQRLRR
ncbi:glycosyltransferase [Nocardiopsis ansamitocini]|uniref:Glycosyltransferase n=1 Tax=Nocardiopsis ansamitocini TaxID=1670832 RepID=A0A9W6P9N2_9ACTN|nr:glycosyltransferase [Nocardiopsis ansamitocini]GLU49710.1 hypothetical protein Nans01_40610 [Nocardiopsis ansamitocini]